VRIFQVATFQMQWKAAMGAKALRLGWAKGPSAAAGIRLEKLLLGKLQFRKLPLGKIPFGSCR